MKKLIKNLMMVVALVCGTMSVTSCDEFMETIFGEWDNPTPQNSTTDSTPTPEELAQRVAQAQALLDEAREEGSVISFSYTVDGVEKTAVFKRVGGVYQLQSPSGTRGDSGDELMPVFIDMDGVENLDEADEDDDPDGEPESVFENSDGDDDENLVDDEDPSVDPDKLTWDDNEEGWAEGYDGDNDIDDGGEDVDADGENDGGSNAGTRAALSRGSGMTTRFMVVCLRDAQFYDHCQIILNRQTATYTIIQAVDKVSAKTRADGGKSYKTIGFSGSILVNGKVFTLQNKYEEKESVPATRASGAIAIRGKDGLNIKITGVNLAKDKSSSIDGGKTLFKQAYIIPRNAKVKSILWKSSKTKQVVVNKATIGKANFTKCLITTKSVGNCKLTCTATGTTDKSNYKSASYDIHVMGHPANVVLHPKSLTLTVGGESKQLTATVYNIAPGESKAVTWKSSDTKVATVVKGLVNPVGKGTALITCTTVGKGTNNLSRVVTCPVTVIGIGD